MRHASLFSGIGGPEIAAAMMGWENVFHCEINPFGRAALEYWFPESDSYEDITTTEFTKYRGGVDIITGGFPCQPFSAAGKRGGAEDDRYLWPEMLRVIEEVRPAWVVGENVDGILSMVESPRDVEVGRGPSLFGEGYAVYERRERFTVERVCGDLERAGYSVQPVRIPACAVGAPHRRNRVFFIAHLDEIAVGDGCRNREYEKQERFGDIWDSCTGNIKRICDTERVDVTIPGDARLSATGAGEPAAGTTGSHTRHDERFAPDTDSGRRGEVHELLQPRQPDGKEFVSNGGERSLADSVIKRPSTAAETGLHGTEERERKNISTIQHPDYARLEKARWDGFPSVSPVHRGNDGIPIGLDNLSIPFNRWREESIKAYGNAIVPQVMYEIFRAIEVAEKEYRKTRDV